MTSSRIIASKNVNYYDYNEFNIEREIGSGGFSNVYQANWKNIVVALKSLKNYNNDTKELVNNEIEILCKVKSHTNIIKFFGITERKNSKDDLDSNYSLILEFASDGTLRNYLKNNFNELDWNIKLQLATQLTDAVSFMHQQNIIHCDLHSNNILVHQNMIKIADFGLSQTLSSSEVKTSDVFGIVPYIDPQYIKTNKINKKSDVYSVGVLLWVISSGQEPFKFFDDNQIRIQILSYGKREIPISGTPDDYINIYKKCWQDNPDDRPDMQQVFSELKLINLSTNEMKTLSISENIDTREQETVVKSGAILTKKINTPSDVLCNSESQSVSTQRSSGHLESYCVELHSPSLRSRLITENINGNDINSISQQIDFDKLLEERITSEQLMEKEGSRKEANANCQSKQSKENNWKKN